MSDVNMNLTRSRLEASVQDVIEKGKEYLIDEFRNVLESNKPYQTKADYIGYSILSIDEKINLLNQEIENLLEYKQRLKDAKDIALQIGAKVFNEYSITKIEGNALHSITFTTGTETTKLEVEVLDEEALIQQGFYKKVIDKEKILACYVNGDYKDLISLHANINQVIYIKPASLRINKRTSTNNINFNVDNFGVI